MKYSVVREMARECEAEPGVYEKTAKEWTEKYATVEVMTAVSGRDWPTMYRCQKSSPWSLIKVREVLRMV
jgi:hypothetical protein